MPHTPESYLTLKDSDPYPFYRQELDEGSDSYWDEGMKAFMILDHEGCARVQRDETVFGHPYWDLPGAVEVQGGARQLMMLHGAEHTRVHRFMMKHFTPRMSQAYVDRYVTPLSLRLIERFSTKGNGNLVEDFCDSLPPYVICLLLGVSIDDEELLANCKHWNDDIMRWSETFGQDPLILQNALSSAKNLANVLLPIIRDRKENPQDDFISALWQGGSELLPDWNENDVLAQARVLLFAGSETTTHLIRNALYVLLDKPAMVDELIASPELVSPFIEEVLRFYGVIHFRIRTATEDTEVGGCPVMKGDRVHPVIAAANRDAEVFENPDEFRIDRANVRDHLAFGLGPRMCIGANLARAEAVEAIKLLLTHLPDLRWDSTPGTPKAEFKGHMPRSYTPLFAQWTPTTVKAGSL